MESAVADLMDNARSKKPPTEANGAVQHGALLAWICRSLGAKGWALWSVVGGVPQRAAVANFAPSIKSAHLGTAFKKMVKDAPARVIRTGKALKAHLSAESAEDEACEFLFVPLREDGDTVRGVLAFRGKKGLQEAFMTSTEVPTMLPSLLRMPQNDAANAHGNLAGDFAVRLLCAEREEAARAAVGFWKEQPGVESAAVLVFKRGRWRLLVSSEAPKLDRRASGTAAVVGNFVKGLAGANPQDQLAAPLSKWAPDEPGAGLFGVYLVLNQAFSGIGESLMCDTAPLLARALGANAEKGASRFFKHRATLLLAIAALVVLACWPVKETFTGRCELIPTQRAAVVAEVSARVDAVLVREGEEVAAGTSLATLAPRGIRASLAVAKEEHLSARAEARKQLERRDLVALRQAMIEARKAGASAELLESELEKTVLRAPIDGVVLTKDPHLLAGQVANPSVPLLEIADLSRWNLEIQLSEGDAGALAPLLANAGNFGVRYSLHANPGLTLRTRLSNGQLGRTAYPEQGGTYVYATIPDVEVPSEMLNLLRPGFTGLAKVEGPRRPLALVALAPLYRWFQLRFLL